MPGRKFTPSQRKMRARQWFLDPANRPDASPAERFYAVKDYVLATINRLPEGLAASLVDDLAEQAVTLCDRASELNSKKGGSK